MTKRRLAAYGLNLVGVALLYALITLAFTFNAFGKSTTYIQGICTTACYTIIMVTSLNLVVGFMGEFSMGHAGLSRWGPMFPLSFPVRWPGMACRTWRCCWSLFWRAAWPPASWA